MTERQNNLLLYSTEKYVFSKEICFDKKMNKFKFEIINLKY